MVWSLPPACSDFYSYRVWNPDSWVEIRERRQREGQKGNESTKAVLRLWLRILRTHSDSRLSSLSRCSLRRLIFRHWAADVMPLFEKRGPDDRVIPVKHFIAVCEEIRQPQGVIVICRSVRCGRCWYGNSSHRDSATVLLPACIFHSCFCLSFFPGF